MQFKELVQALLWCLDVSTAVAGLQMLVISYGIYDQQTFESKLGMLHTKIP